jgi:chromosome segregation ATPase
MELQSAACIMAVDLGEALAEAQAATEEAARHSSKDLLAEMNEAMKTRGEVAAQLAEKLSEVERDRNALTEGRKNDAKIIEALEEKCKSLKETTNDVSLLQAKLLESEQKVDSLQHSHEENLQKIASLINTCKENEEIALKLKEFQEQNQLLLLEKVRLEDQIKKQETVKHQNVLDLEGKNAEISDFKITILSLQEKLNEFTNVLKENESMKKDLEALQMEITGSSSLCLKLEQIENQLLSVTSERDSLLEEVMQLKSLPLAQNKEEVIQEMQNENLRLKESLLEYTNKTKELEKLKINLKQQESTIQSLSNENSKLLEVNAEYQECKSQLEQTVVVLKQQQKKQLEISQEQIELMEKQISNLQEDKNKFSELTEIFEHEKLKLGKLENIEREKDILADNTAKLQTQNDQLCKVIKDLEKQLSQKAEFENEKVSKEFEDLSNKNKELLINNQNLKEKLMELEKEREECDGASVSTVSRTEDAARLRDVEESFEERYTKLRAVAVKLKQKCHDQAGVLTKVLSERTELQSKLTACSKDRDILAKNLQSMQAACDSATDEAETARDKVAQSNKELKRAGEELARARNQHAEAVEKYDLLESKLQQALADLEAAKQESKKNSVLNLEMAAYERSAAEQDKKLTQLKEEIQSLGEKLENQKSIASQNLKEAKHWEENCMQLSSSKAKVEEALAQLKTQLNATREQLAEQSQKYSESVARYEAKHSELERLELHLAELTAEKLRNDETSKNFQEQATRQIRILEDQMATAQATINSREADIAALQAEFEGYKVRAQSVLHRQQQKQQTHKEDLTKEAERESELTLLKATVEKLQTVIAATGEREKNLHEEVSVISGHNTALQASARSLASQITELNSRCEDLKNKIMKGEEALRDANRQHRLALDTLSSSYKHQLAEAETRHKAQMARLQAAQEEIKELNQQPQISLVEHDQQPVLQQREEGEGSENVDSPKATASMDHRREPLPLERLLSNSSDYPDDVKSEISLDAASMTSVLAAEKRAKHLSALLSEAEADLARLTQQNSVLKEEIRRQQRCMERQQHTLSNGEYLKNVVLKFITLQGGDERARLVPVLNTILKLSPEETQQLQIVATGTAPSSGSASASTSGWGSYLHLWSGTH